MNQNRKYLGMTMAQIGILAGLAGFALLLFCIVGWLVMRRGFGGNQVIPPTPSAQPTVTLIVNATATSTPAPTPVPYETLIPTGWTQYQTPLYELWMLPGYKSASPDILLTGLGNSPVLDLSLSGTYTPKSANKVYITVSYEPLTDTFDKFLNDRLTALGPLVSGRSSVTLNGVPATRLVFSGRKGNNNTDINELTYVVLDGSTVWYIQYTAEITDFYSLLADFEASAKTFRLVK
jgi:hypothetical protein